MSKNKGKDFHDNEEIKDKLHIESKILDTPNLMDQFTLSSVVKINNPGEEIKITIDNMTNVGENKVELLPEVVKELNKSEAKDNAEKVTINILNNQSDKKNHSLGQFRNEFDKSDNLHESVTDNQINAKKENEFNPLEELKKGFAKISIVDVSKNKENKQQSSNPVRSVMQKAASMSPVSMEHLEEKAFDSLIYIGGSFIAATSIASKTLAGVGSSFIKK